MAHFPLRPNCPAWEGVSGVFRGLAGALEFRVPAYKEDTCSMRYIHLLFRLPWGRWPPA